MNISISESDKRLLSILVAFVLAAAFFFLVFQPILEKNTQLQKEISQVKEQENAMNVAASLSGDMIRQEQEARTALDEILLCFYPMLQSQEAENMITVLMLNHSLQVQDMSITAAETSSDLPWYQYSAYSSGEMPAEAQSDTSAIVDDFGIYTIRFTCTANGSKENLMAVVDDISVNYPAISILGTEWSVTERQVETALNAGDGMEENEVQAPTMRTEVTNSLTISLEIYMYRQ